MTAEEWTPVSGPHGTGSSAGSAAAARGAQIRARPRPCAAAPAATCSAASGFRQGSALAEFYELTQQPVLACGMGVMKRLFQELWIIPARDVAEKCDQSASKQVLTAGLLPCRCLAERAATCQWVIRAHQADAC